MPPLTRRLTTLLVGASLLCIGMPSIGLAQDDTPSPAPSGSEAPQACGLLTADEVSSALSLSMTVADGGSSTCEFDSDDASGTFALLLTDIVSVDLSTARDFMCGGGDTGESPVPTADPTCAVDVQVGQAAGIYLPDSTSLYVDIGGGSVLSLQLAGDPVADVDTQAALTSLAGLALPRLAGMPLPTAEPEETEGPLPSLTRDADLEAQFPKEIGGQPVDVTSASGHDIGDGADIPDEFLTALSEVGKSLDDVSMGWYYAPDGSSAIVAYRVQGADMPALAPRLLPILYQSPSGDEDSPEPAPSMTQVAQTIAGKDTTAVTVDGTTQYLYPHGDVLWLVYGEEPTLTEIFQKLP